MGNVSFFCLFLKQLMYSVFHTLLLPFSVLITGWKPVQDTVKYLKIVTLRPTIMILTVDYLLLINFCHLAFKFLPLIHGSLKH